MSWLPNLLTCLRIGLTPVIVYTLLARQFETAFVLSVAAGFTDAFDGLLARRFGWMSRTGAYLDPIADKLLLTSLYVSFGAIGLVPWWLPCLVVGRDVVILLMAAGGLLFTTIRDFPPSIWGKISTVIQIIAAGLVLAACAGIRSVESLTVPAIWATTLGTAWSGVHYVWRGFYLLRRSRG